MTTALYIRTSTSGQKSDSQELELRRYCEQRGWTEFEVYEDQIGGAKPSRPALDRLMRDLRSGRVTRVVCYKLDRLGRSLTHLALILDEMAKLKVPLICCSQGIDTSDDNPAGKLQLGVLMAVAEFERSIIRERVNSGLAAARARGVRLGRPGWLASRRRDVMQLRGQGFGPREISRRLKMPPSSVSKVLAMGPQTA